MAGSVDWHGIGNPLPIERVPAEKTLRQELFATMDVNKNGWLTLTEVLAGLPKLLEDPTLRKPGEKAHYLVKLEDLRPAATAAFHMARHVAPPSDGRKRSASDCIDRREFHALLVAFRIVIELDVIFEAADQSDDRMLNWKEVEKVLDKLEIYNVSAKQARQKFPDDWTQSMTFKKFTEWCIVRRFHSCGHCGGPALELDENDPEATLKDAAGSGNLGAILKAFKDWDTDQNESISQEELAAVLIELDPTFTQEMAHELFADADINQDGKLDFIEFNAWVTSAVDPEKPASATAADATPSAEA